MTLKNRFAPSRLLLVVCVIALGVYGCRSGDTSGDPVRTGQIHILFAGDTAFGESYQRVIVQQKGEDILRTRGYDHGFAGLLPLLKRADRVVANLETPVTSLPASPLAGRKSYLHWSDIHAAPAALAKHNIKHLSLANNHTMDYGLQGLEQTLDVLRQNSLETFGAGASAADAARPLALSYELNGSPLRVLVAAGFEYRPVYDRAFRFYASKDKGGVNAWSIPRAAAQIRSLRGKNPEAFIIAFPHWGKNYQWKTTGQTALAHALIDSGADLVLGHGAHRLQEIEMYRDRWIIYSLGNFVFNAPGRYAEHDGPPFSLAALMAVTEEKWEFDCALSLYPVMSDNRITGYQPRFATKKEFDTLYQSILDQSSGTGALKARLATGQDDVGPFIRLNVTPEP